MEAKIPSCWQQRVDVVIEKLEKIMQNQQKLFGNSSLDAQIKLSQLSQVSSVLDYQIEFEKLSSIAIETRELILVSLFISGLKPEIRWKLQLNRLFTLKEAFVFARYHELRLEGLRMTRNEVVDDLVDSNAIIEIVENDAMFDYVETKVVENVEVEFAKDFDMLITEISSCSLMSLRRKNNYSQ